MIAVVSSTIKPTVKTEKQVSLYSFDERLKQTKQTITLLLEHQFTQVFLVDNSQTLDQIQLEQLLVGFPNLKVFHLRQFQFLNKGLNELLMLLFLTDYLPVNETIFKISGRYYPSEKFLKPDFTDFAFRGYHYKKKNGTLSTRGYWVKNVDVFRRFLLESVDELFAYPERIVGVKSLIRALFYKKNVIDDPLNISIEFAAANVLKAGNYDLYLLENIGIEGLVAGADKPEKITE